MQMNPGEVGAILFGILAFLYGGFERWRNLRRNDNQRVEQAKDELIKVLEADRDTWKARYETEREEYISHRKATHDHNNEANARLIKLTDENASLKAKTDITPLLAHQEEQTKINAEVMRTLSKVTATLDLIMHHLKGPLNIHQTES